MRRASSAADALTRPPCCLEPPLAGPVLVAVKVVVAPAFWLDVVVLSCLPERRIEVVTVGGLERGMLGCVWVVWSFALVWFWGGGGGGYLFAVSVARG